MWDSHKTICKTISISECTEHSRRLLAADKKKRISKYLSSFRAVGLSEKGYLTPSFSPNIPANKAVDK